MQNKVLVLHCTEGAQKALDRFGGEDLALETGLAREGARCFRDFRDFRRSYKKGGR